jgi:hypothetical protein
MSKSAASLLRETQFPGEATFATARIQSAARPVLLTIPCDLEEYARVHTGPSSWSAETDAHVFEGETDPATEASFESLFDG